MFSIDRRKIKRKITSPDMKETAASLVPVVYDHYKLEIWNLTETLQSFDAFNLGNWVIHHDRWINNLTQPENTTKYERRDILMVELGSVNFRFEPSYEHPCVVLINGFSFILIAPCSSKKFGRGYPEVIDATPGDGFQINTGIQMDGVRWVHKNRVTNKIGQISEKIMGKIEQHMLDINPRYVSQMEELMLKLEIRDREIEEKENEILKFQEKVKHQDSILHELQKILSQRDNNPNDALKLVASTLQSQQEYE